MYHIQTSGYNVKEKIIIANKYLIPKIALQVNFPTEDILISSIILEHIITYTQKEQGVRNLKRCLETIYTKLNLFRLLEKDISLLSDELNFEITFPFTLTKEIVDIFLKSKKDTQDRYLSMYN